MDKTFIITGYLNDEPTKYTAYTRQEADEISWELADQGYEDINIEELRV